MVGALLAASPALPASFGLDLLRQNVRTIVRDAGGYRRFNAELRHPMFETGFDARMYLA
jgi:hypothetical protein